MSFFCALRDRLHGTWRDGLAVSRFQVELATGVSAQAAKLLKKKEYFAKKIDRAKAKKDVLINRTRRQQEHAKKVDLRAKKELLEQERERLKRFKDRMSADHSSINSARAELGRTEANFVRWREAVGRPPFAEQYLGVVETLRRQRQDSSGNGSDNDESVDGVEQSFWQRLLPYFFGILTAALVPLDILYTQPGFFLLLENQYLSYAAAALYIFILVIIGRTIRVLYRYSISRRLIEVKQSDEVQDNKDELASTRNPVLLAMLVLTVVIGFSAVYAGTTVRSLVPTLSAINKQIDALQLEETVVANQQFRSQIGAEEAKARVEEINDSRQEQVERFNEAALRLYPIPSADALIAFVFYTVVIIGTLTTGLAKTDPIFEYFLAYREYVVAKRGVIYLESVIDNRIEQLELEVKESEVAISAVESLEISEESILDDRRVVDQENTIQELEDRLTAVDADIESHSITSREFIKVRSLKYARYLSWLTRSKQPLEEWEKLHA